MVLRRVGPRFAVVMMCFAVAGATVALVVLPCLHAAASPAMSGHVAAPMFASEADSPINPLFGLLGKSLLSTPQVSGFGMVRGLWEASLVIADSGYVLLVVIGGIVAVGHQTIKRSFSAKGIAPRIVTGFIAANLSLLASGKAIEFANAVSTTLAGQGLDPGASGTIMHGLVDRVLPEGGMFFILLSVFTLAIVLVLAVIFVARLVMTVVLISMAPLALACHTLPRTEGFARRWWRAFAGILAVQAAQALVLVAAAQVFFSEQWVSLILKGAIGSQVAVAFDDVQLLCLLYIVTRIPFWICRRLWSPTGRNPIRNAVRFMLTATVLRRLTPVLAGRAARGGTGGRGPAPGLLRVLKRGGDDPRRAAEGGEEAEPRERDGDDPGAGETEASGTQASGTEASGTTAGEATAGEPERDETAAADAEADETAASETTADEAWWSEPSAAQPGTGEPGMGEPGAGEPGTGEPGADEPGSGEAGAGWPGAGELGLDWLGMGWPGEEETGADEPGQGGHRPEGDGTAAGPGNALVPHPRGYGGRHAAPPLSNAGTGGHAAPTPPAASLPAPRVPLALPAAVRQPGRHAAPPALPARKPRHAIAPPPPDQDDADDDPTVLPHQLARGADHIPKTAGVVDSLTGGVHRAGVAKVGVKRPAVVGSDSLAAWPGVGAEHGGVHPVPRGDGVRRGHGHGRPGEGALPAAGDLLRLVRREGVQGVPGVADQDLAKPGHVALGDHEPVAGCLIPDLGPVVKVAVAEQHGYQGDEGAEGGDDSCAMSHHDSLPYIT